MSASCQTVTLTTAQGVRTITLNRPDSVNAYTAAMRKELLDALEQAEDDEAARCLVITGAGRAFGSGQDLAELRRWYADEAGSDLGQVLRQSYNPLIRRMRQMDKPIIAAVNGVAAGAGFSLALACDIRIASEQASFIQAFVKVGLIPDLGSTFYLPRLVGLGRAAELCFTGEGVSAEEAWRLGLVNRVVGPEDLMTTATELARKLADLPTKAIGLTKRLLNRALATDLDAQLEAETFAQVAAGKTADHREGVTAFIEKRKPQFRGK